MKIKDVIAESLYDTLTGFGQSMSAAKAGALDKKANIGGIEKSLAAGQNPQEIYNGLLSRGISASDAKKIMATVGGEDKREKAYNKKIAGIRARAQQSAQQAKNPQPEPDSGPADDVKDIVAPDEQYRFSHPDYPGEGINIIVRNTGWYLDKLPQALRGRVKRDSATRLYPVLQPNNIKKYNLYYNQAADANRVRHEPAHSL